MRAAFLPARGERAGLGFGDSASGDYFFCNVCARIFFCVSENFGIAARYTASFVDANFHSRFFKRLRLAVSAIGIPRGAFDAARISRRFYMDSIWILHRFRADFTQILRRPIEQAEFVPQQPMPLRQFPSFRRAFSAVSKQSQRG